MFKDRNQSLVIKTLKQSYKFESFDMVMPAQHPFSETTYLIPQKFPVATKQVEKEDDGTNYTQYVANKLFQCGTVAEEGHAT